LESTKVTLFECPKTERKSGIEAHQGHTFQLGWTKIEIEEIRSQDK